MSAWSAAAGGLAGGVIGHFSAQNLQEDSQNFTTEQLQNRHQWEVADLRAAGLNPILSAGAAPSIGSSGIATIPNYSESLMNNMRSESAISKMNAETVNVIQDTVLKESGVELNLANVEKVQKIAEQLHAQTQLTQQDFIAKAYQNTYNKIEANLFQNNEWMAQLKAMGIDGKAAVDILRSIIGTLHFGKGIIKNPLRR